MTIKNSDTDEVIKKARQLQEEMTRQQRRDFWEAIQCGWCKECGDQLNERGVCFCLADE